MSDLWYLTKPLPSSFSEFSLLSTTFLMMVMVKYPKLPISILYALTSPSLNQSQHFTLWSNPCLGMLVLQFYIASVLI